MDVGLIRRVQQGHWKELDPSPCNRSQIGPHELKRSSFKLRVVQNKHRLC